MKRKHSLSALISLTAFDRGLKSIRETDIFFLRYQYNKSDVNNCLCFTLPCVIKQLDQCANFAHDRRICDRTANLAPLPQL